MKKDMSYRETDREDNDYSEHKGHVFMKNRMAQHPNGTHHVKLACEDSPYEAERG